MSKSLTPYEQFYAYMRKRLGMSKERFDKMSVSDFTVSKGAGKILAGRELSWLYKYSDRKFMGKKYIKRAFEMWRLQWSPREGNVPEGKCEINLGGK
jgi:hypothetical protein